MAHQLKISELEARFAPYGPLALRVGLGVVFLAQAWAKAAVYTFDGTAGYFEAHGFPGWTAYPVFFVELVAGLALLAGFHTRAVALLLVPVMLGALKPHLGNGWMFTAQGGGWEYVAFLIVALLSQAALGSGALSYDARAKSEMAPSNDALAARA